MKLRVRSLETKETLRIEVPDSCCLRHFKDVISHRLSSSPSSSSSALHLSLNRKDELPASSPQDSLRSLGITSGDLLFYTIHPHAFSPPPSLPLPSQTPGSQLKTQDSTQLQERPLQGLQIQGSEESGMSAGNSKQDKAQDFEIPDVNTQEGETLEFGGTDEMDVDDGRVVVDDDDEMGSKGFSVPGFLRKVLMEEVNDDDGGGHHKLLVIAVHAVLLESGFVGFDSVSGTTFERFHLPVESPSTSFSMTLRYTLPKLATSDSSCIETVVLKFQNLGKFVIVYGSLAGKNGSRFCRVCLDEHRFAPSMSLVWKNTCSSGNVLKTNVSSESEVFEFWKIVKDGLALPLMISICESSGLGLPPCLMCLSTDLKLKILEHLPGNSIAKMGCVCLEFRYLSTWYNDLWKQKFAEEFGGNIVGQEGTLWKDTFALWWESRKGTKPASVVSRPFHAMHIRPLMFYSLFSFGGETRYRHMFRRYRQRGRGRGFPQTRRSAPFPPHTYLPPGG